MAPNLLRRDRREFRSTVGGAVVDAMLTTNARVGRLENMVLKRGFWGRLKWLLLGK
jgi:hypothetical protein